MTKNVALSPPVKFDHLQDVCGYFDITPLKPDFLNDGLSFVSWKMLCETLTDEMN